ncbi:MAG: hypothetical protein AWU58_1999 [Methanohalophilus sp. T328-1]|nr:MAG: hypothetical protein AWU58_1999 [Methanohalophilus sp. T328-1]
MILAHLVRFLITFNLYSILKYMTTTTIKVDSEVKNNLDNLKLFPRESYNEVLSRLVGMAYDEEPLSEDTLKRVEEALHDKENITHRKK